ncbi:MAG: FAD-binding protein [Spirochaetaceae bacterium]|nr:MAG: FAD-binding protein [Spirochaetaceae bacterium]
MYSHDIIIIGGGAAGLSVASGCAQLGMKTAVIEREHMGGDCLHFGCVPSKTLLHIAARFAAQRDAAAFSHKPPAALEPQMSAVNARIAAVIGKIAFHDSPERFRALGAEVYLGSGSFISEHEVEVDGRRLSARTIVISTGSRAAIPPVEGLEGVGYLTNRDVFSLAQLPRSLAILGAGPIGVELGQAFRRLGTEVTIVDMAPRILPRDDPEMSAIVAARLEREGIRSIMNARAERVSAANGAKQVDLSTTAADGSSETQTLSADEILVAAGRVANTDSLNAAAAGIEIGPRGYIAVDNKLRSNVRHIYAIGDTNGTFPFTHVAGAEAALVVRRVALHAGGSMNYRCVPWVSYTDPELASVGHSEDSATREGIQHRVVRQSFSGVDRAHAEDATDGLLKIVLDRRERVIGVQIAAAGAGELLSPALHAVSKRWKLSAFRSAMTPYPTMAEVYARAVSAQMAPRLFNPRMRKILRAVFRYRGPGPQSAAQSDTHKE